MTEQEAISVLKMIETQGSLPTLAKELSIKALEKQIPRKPIIQSTDRKSHYKCICGIIQLTRYKDGYRMGAKREYCDRCGQKLDWSE